jgi:hypothetical protein
MQINITKEAKRKRERKNNILQELSKLEEMDSHARLAMLGAAMKRKKTGRSIAGTESLPRKRWYSVTKSTK